MYVSERQTYFSFEREGCIVHIVPRDMRCIGGEYATDAAGRINGSIICQLYAEKYYSEMA